MMVTPKLLPLPLGLPTITYWLGQVALTFHVKLICARDGTFIVTVQFLDPDTPPLRLYRSPHFWPADSVAVQPPPPPPPPVVGPPVGPPVLPPPPEPSLTVM